MGGVVFFHVAVYLIAWAGSPPFETVCTGLWGEPCTFRPMVVVLTLFSAVTTGLLVRFLLRRGFVRATSALVVSLVAAALFLGLVVNPEPCPEDLNLGVYDGTGGWHWECFGIK